MYPNENDAANDPDDANLSNLQEYLSGADPHLIDTDGDSMPDGWEISHGLSPISNDAAADPDKDTLTNLEEYLNGTDPHVDNASLADADQDGMPDIWELANGLDPNYADASADPDGDGLTNLEEYLNATDPNIDNSTLPDSSILSPTRVAATHTRPRAQPCDCPTGTTFPEDLHNWRRGPWLAVRPLARGPDSRLPIERELVAPRAKRAPDNNRPNLDSCNRTVRSLRPATTPTPCASSLAQ